MLATVTAAAVTASARASTDHIASRVCGPTEPNPSRRARRARSSGSRVPPDPPAPAGETSAWPYAALIRPAFRTACSANPPR